MEQHGCRSNIPYTQKGSIYDGKHKPQPNQYIGKLGKGLFGGFGVVLDRFAEDRFEFSNIYGRDLEAFRFLGHIVLFSKRQSAGLNAVSSVPILAGGFLFWIWVDFVVERASYGIVHIVPVGPTAIVGFGFGILNLA